MVRSHPRSTRSTAIVVDDLSVSFRSDAGQVDALKDVSVQAATDEFVCVMGPSGCGKTTILNAIAGFVQPTKGTVTVGGAPVRGPGSDRAVVFQDDAVFPWMTVEQNVSYSMRMRGAGRADIQRSVEHYLNLVGLWDFRKAWPRQLSGGMKKRVDLARAYAAQPRVLLLDEPFGALDPLTKEYLQEELHRVHEAEPRTTLFITHDMEEAVFLGDRVIVMTPRPGRIAAVYEPALPRPRNANIKTDDRFISLMREIRATLSKGGEPS